MALVTSISSMFKTYPNNSKEENVLRRNKMLFILDKTLDQFAENLNRGKIKINSTLDLERIVRSSCLVMDESEQKPADTTDTSENATKQNLNINDPDVKSVYQKLFTTYNSENDTE